MAQSGVTVSERSSGERFARLLEAVRKRVNKHQYATWFQRTSLVRWADNDLVIGLPNRFYQEWFQKNFQELLTHAAEEIGHAPVRVAFEIAAPTSTPQAASRLPAEAEGEGQASGGPPETAKGGWPPGGAGQIQDGATEPQPFMGSGPEDLPLHLNEHYTFANFIVGPSNRVACASARAVALDPGRAYNPLFLHGSVGLGKTHLLHAVCREFLGQRPGERICFLSCEEFTNEFVQALQRHDLERFRERFRNVHLLVIDDIHFLVGKERIQDEFFHTFNRLYQSHHQIVISSDAPPTEIPTLQDRLVSRFKWGLVAKIEQPEMETRMAIVRRKAELMGIEVPNGVVEFIASNFQNNIRELEGALLSVIARADVASVPIDLPLAQTALQDSIASGSTHSPTMDRITETVAAYFKVKISDLRSKRRSRSISTPRQVVMYFAKELTSLSLEEIGDHFGGRDHSTVLYGIRKVKDKSENESRFAAELERLRDRLGVR
ncbi:MAG: chromosomal replication initiator protein DnaA [Planctomycetota bacterium]|jgi:chromosomal replication initiator protein